MIKDTRFVKYGFTMPELPEQRVGDWSIEYFSLSQEQARIATMREAQSTFPFRVDPGDYVKLIFQDDVNTPEVVMSNTWMECATHNHPKRFGTGSILINGLGLGMIAQTLALKDDVDRITVIEKSPDVIAMVQPYLHDKITVIEADAYTWSPPKHEKYDYVWHDIWHNVDRLNLPEMQKLHRKYGRRSHGQESWFRQEMKKQIKEEDKHLQKLLAIARERFGDDAVDELIKQRGL